MYALAGTAAEVFTPEGRLPLPEFDPAQKAENITAVPVSRNAQLSTAFVRLLDREQPHVHEASDLVVHVLEGEGVLHFSQRSEPIKTGDVVIVPRGEQHWAENTGQGAMLVFVTFAPAN